MRAASPEEQAAFKNLAAAVVEASEPVAQRSFAPVGRMKAEKARRAERHPGATIETFAADEHRIGLKPVTRRVWAPRGERPVAPCHHRFEWLYAFAARTWPAR